MAGTALIYDFSGLDRFAARLARLTRLDRRQLLDDLGAALESQTRRRIQEEKESPGGEEWADWSPRYAARRHGGHSLLMAEGHLDDSITHVPGNDEVEAGSNLIYGATHQFGDPERNIPARSWLGLSDDNEAELDEIAAAFLDQVVNL